MTTDKWYWDGFHDSIIRELMFAKCFYNDLLVIPFEELSSHSIHSNMVIVYFLFVKLSSGIDLEK